MRGSTNEPNVYFKVVMETTYLSLLKIKKLHCTYIYIYTVYM